MAPPLEAPISSEPASPFVLDEVPAPTMTATTVAGPETGEAAPAPQPEVSVVASPAVTVDSRDRPEEKSAFERKLWQRLHVVIGGGGSFGTRVYGEPDPFNLAAQKLSGPMLFIQPTFTLLTLNAREEKPNGDFELRAGLELKNHFLGNNTDKGQPESRVDARSIGVLAEGIYHLTRFFGLGLNANFGRMGLISENADVGAPFDATLEWGSEGGLSLGGQVFATVWDGNIRVAFNYDQMLNAFDLNAGAGNPALKTAMDPMVGFGIGVDPLGIISTLMEEKSEEKNKKKSK